MSRAKQVDPAAVPDEPHAPWIDYADLVLQRAALLFRATRGRSPDPLAGLRISDESIDDLLRELPGLDHAADPDLARRIEAEARPQLVAALDAFMTSAVGDSPLGAAVVNSRLTVTEACTLALLAAVEMDVNRQRLVAYLNDDVSARWITPSTLRLVTPDPGEVHEALLAVGPGGGLRRACLLRPEADAGWAHAPIRLHPNVVWWLLGDRTPDTALPAATRLVTTRGRGEADLVVVAGEDRIRRTQAVVGALRGNGFLLTPVPEPGGWDPIVRYASLAGLGVIVEVSDELPTHATDRIERTVHLPWAISSKSELALGSLPRRPWTHIEVAGPAASADEIAAMFDSDVRLPATLTADQLESVAGAARAMRGDVDSAIRRLASGGLSSLTERVVPSRNWDDLVLPEREQALLREVAIRARHRTQVYDVWGFDASSPGVLALFAWPSGTGKSLAAEVIANELRLDLYRVDLSRVVDKYIGETEKKLGAVFDVAQANPMVLLLDEADALLGKRTEVSDAHDRYANIEVAYLLQRLERYNGVVVFASNFANNIDTAFVRRIHVFLHFQLPRPHERRRIWDKCVPEASRAPDVDLDRLAEGLEISGGQIRNTAVRAAFLAAEEGRPLTMSHLIESAAREMQNARRLFPTDKFDDIALGLPGPDRP